MDIDERPRRVLVPAEPRRERRLRLLQAVRTAMSEVHARKIRARDVVPGGGYEGRCSDENDVILHWCTFRLNMKNITENCLLHLKIIVKFTAMSILS